MFHLCISIFYYYLPLAFAITEISNSSLANCSVLHIWNVYLVFICVRISPMAIRITSLIHIVSTMYEPFECTAQ